MAPSFHYEKKAHKQGFSNIAGIDEAGRGPLAGPLVVSACSFSPHFWEEGSSYFLDPLLQSIDDSKKLTSQKRALIASQILEHPHITSSVVFIDVATIDEKNILGATLFGMKEAALSLKEVPDYLLIDGNRAPPIDIPQEMIVKGDGLSLSIAAASIIAKTKRDEWMRKVHETHPKYGFDRHKGYPTKEHIKALSLYGVTPIHRRSFAPVKRVLKAI